MAILISQLLPSICTLFLSLSLLLYLSHFLPLSLILYNYHILSPSLSSLYLSISHYPSLYLALIDSISFSSFIYLFFCLSLLLFLSLFLFHFNSTSNFPHLSCFHIPYNKVTGTLCFYVCICLFVL